MSIVKKILAWIVAKLKALIFGKPVVAGAPTAPITASAVPAPVVIVTPKS